MAATIRAEDPDFIVSGAIFHPPEGMRDYGLTGLFGDPLAARAEFFPPSSIGHRRDALERIGGWADPAGLDRPIDVELLQRAVAAGLTFASTCRITVHKFTAADRYMAYRFATAPEQEAMLERLGEPMSEARLLGEVLERVSRGATIAPRPYRNYAAEDYQQTRQRLLKGKGVAPVAPLAIETSAEIPVDEGPGLRDWRTVTVDDKLGAFRWSHRNANPNYFLNIGVTKPFTLKIHIARIGDVDMLGLRIDDAPARFRLDPGPFGSLWMVTRPDVAFPVERGLKLTFVTRAPGSAAGDAPDARRIAIGKTIVTVD